MKRKDFNSTKEYIEHLIYKENALNLKNIVLLLLIIGAIALITVQFTGYVKHSGVIGEHFTIEEMKEALLQAGYSQEEIDSFSEEEINSRYTEISLSNKNQTAGNTNYSEYPEQDSSILKQDYYLKASKGEFDSIISDFEDKKLKYQFSSSYNKELITIYNDAYYLKTIINNNITDSFKIKEVLSSIKDARMLVYGTLLTEEKYRREIIIDKFSLSPILLNKQVNITSVFSTSMVSLNCLDKNKNDSRFNEMAEYLNEGNYIFYKIDFTVDKNPLTAYIYKNTTTLELSFYGMYSADNSDIYLRVYDFIQMESNSTQNNSSNHNSSSMENSTSGASNSNIEPNDNLETENNDSFTGNNSNESLHNPIDESTIEDENGQNNDTSTDEEFHVD